jgi:hypothetical protein
MRGAVLAATVVAMMVAIVAQADAGCRWEWLCDQYGKCAQKPICDSTLDIVPPRPPSVAPIVPPSIQPIPTPTIPPIGTRQCRQVRRCDSWGNCVWDTVCY